MPENEFFGDRETNTLSYILLLYNEKQVKPQSDIHCNRSATSPRPKFLTIAARGRRGVATRFCSWSATDRGLVAD